MDANANAKPPNTKQLLKLICLLPLISMCGWGSYKFGSATFAPQSIGYRVFTGETVVYKFGEHEIEAAVVTTDYSGDFVRENDLALDVRSIRLRLELGQLARCHIESITVLNKNEIRVFYRIGNGRLKGVIFERRDGSWRPNPLRVCG